MKVQRRLFRKVELIVVVWLQSRGYERLLEVRTQLTGEGFRGLGNLAVGGAGSGESGLVPQHVCLIWVLGSLVHLCLDSVGQLIFLDSLLCASSGPSPAQVSISEWGRTRGKESCAAIQARVGRASAEPSALV